MFWVNGTHLGWVIFGGLTSLLLWAGLIALVVLAIQALTHADSRQSVGSASSSGSTPDGALNILKERYARGEITKDQYDSMRRDLMT